MSSCRQPLLVASLACVNSPGVGPLVTPDLFRIRLLSPTMWSGRSRATVAYRKPCTRSQYSAMLLVVFLLPYAMQTHRTTAAALVVQLTATITEPAPPGNGFSRDPPSKKHTYCVGPLSAASTLGRFAVDRSLSRLYSSARSAVAAAGSPLYRKVVVRERTFWRTRSCALIRNTVTSSSSSMTRPIRQTHRPCTTASAVPT